MRVPSPIPVGAAVALLIAVAAGAPQRVGAEQECGEFGTSVIFADSPVEAARKAQQQEKLVFVLHVSGHFENSDFT